MAPFPAVLPWGLVVAIMSMSKREFDQLEVLLRVQSRRLRVADGSASELWVLRHIPCCLVAVAGRDEHMRGTHPLSKAPVVQASPATDPGRPGRRSGPAHTRARYHPHPAACRNGRLSRLRHDVGPAPQPLRTDLGRPALAGSPSGAARPGAPLPLPSSGLPSADLRRTARRHSCRLGAAHRPARRFAASPWPGTWRQGWRTASRAPIGADQPRHPAAHAGAPGPWWRRSAHPAGACGR